MTIREPFELETGNWELTAPPRRTHVFGFTGALMATNLRAAAALRGAFALQILFMMLNNATFFVFWWALMRRVPDLRGWTLGDIQLLFGVVAAGYGLAVTLAGGVWELGRIIDGGELDALLTQPRPVLLHALGLRLKPSGFGDLLSSVAFIALSDRLSWHAAPLLVLAVAASAVVFVASGIVFASLAFWVGRTETVARQLWDLTVTFALYPEPLFGGAIRLALYTVLPAGLVGYLPARVVLDASPAAAALLVAAAGVYLAIAVTLFNRGLRRYSSGSRFAAFG